jgi:hypothetical protein
MSEITFKNWLSLQEMPLANFRHAFGSLPPNDKRGMSGYFVGEDRIVIKHPKTVRTLERVLSKTGFMFNILMVEMVGGFDSNGKDNYLRQLEYFMADENIPRMGHITFAKTGSSGDLMTPWMILHTLGHALIKTKTQAIQQIASLLESLFILPVQGSMMRVPHLSSFFRFKSAVVAHSHLPEKDRATPGPKIKNKFEMLSTYEELVHELVAEYLWHGGKIRLNLQDMQPQQAQKAAAAVMEIEGIIKGLLQASVGEVITDFYG